MYVFERYCKGIRHSLWLKQAEWLWNALRPLYEKTLSLFYPNGLKRKINGSDSMLIPPSQRSLSETYEPLPWKYLMESVRPGDIAVDVGAHLGLLPLP